MKVNDLQTSLEAALKVAKMKRKDVSRLTGIPLSTLGKRMNEPETMTVKELIKIAKATGMTVVIGDYYDAR